MRAFLVVLSLWSVVAPAAMEPKIIFEHDPTLLTSTIQVVVLSGGQDDPTDKNGLLNLMTELMLRGTKKKSRAVFQSEIERMGATLSVRVTHDLIVFSGKVIRENTMAFLKLIEDCLLRPAFKDAEFKSLKKEILAELAHLKNNNNRLSGLAVRRHLFAGTALERPVEGSLSSVEKITLVDVQKAYNNHFNRGNFVFAAASSLPEADLKKAISATWLAFPDGARRTRKSIALQAPKVPTLVVVHKPRTSTGALMLGQPGITAQDPMRYRLAVGNFSFGGEPLVSRLFKVVRSELGWTYYVGSTYHATGALTHQQGFFVISSTPSVEFTSKTILKLLSMWREYLGSGLKGEELVLAQDSLVNSYPFEFESPEKRLWQKLYSYLYDVPVLSPEDYAKTLYAIDNKQLKESLKGRQDPSAWIIALVADKDVIAKQLEEEQKDVPAEQRLTIAKVMTPDQLVR